MSEHAVRQIGPGLFIIDAHMFGAPENLSTYVIPDPIPTLVEPGPTTCHAAVRAGLAELGLDELAQIVVTHVHLDHAGGTGTLADAFPTAKVFVHEVGARHLQDPHRLYASATRIYGEAGMRDLWGVMQPVPLERLSGVSEGDRIDLGLGRHLEVLYTPGHAKHHMSLVDSQTGIVLVGDSVGLTFPEMTIVHPIVPPPDIDVELLISQFRRYEERGATALGFAHFGLRADVGEMLYESERRLRMWTRVVEENADRPADEVGAALAAANLADLHAHGHPHDHVKRIQDRTNFTTEASGLLRYVHGLRPD
jgi:glyoxylase-like metal-dependent hydrolase (beta-lactamase superfamily II)